MRQSALWGLTILLLLSCKKTNRTLFLQQNQVHLAQPRVQSTTMIIDSFAVIKVGQGFEGSEVYYTSDGSEPTMTSVKYKAPFKVTEPGTYKFRTFHTNWKTSEASMMTLYKKGQVPEDIVWYSKAQTKYKGQGALTLINQNKASLPFSNPEWVGFDSIVDAKVVFKEKTMIKSIDIGFLNDPQSWIFPPSEIVVYLNDLENDSDKIKIQMDDVPTMVSAELSNIKIKIEREVKSVRLEIHNLQSIPEWHEGSGQKAWLFMDEWIFN
ncbi:chitobiase/beta-hexosaminidase C-terminal domain-containing protein [Tamlana sp. 2201CG12-4]|uniref:chitobiase/beta-hexosaminidase C-terminal domain-containing protein n=1 Tax=Tamlana sp. 2201CG12-4 TaxID=3112582 RepID=UPI002DBAEE9A|nr:chitobiase/beta-hexosaminidase C-terminal domain-containing protein [Tamlana sp. 2201CG12-4]MEC3907190.1 chitobiase/beta-hexosaminidase C-terminal domain-containing protein [Tamlana sp. 2201CG12-4]